jgi:predicted S18 family serine protease
MVFGHRLASAVPLLLAYTSVRQRLRATANDELTETLGENELREAAYFDQILRRIEKEREDPDERLLSGASKETGTSKTSKDPERYPAAAAAQTQEALSARLLLDEPSHNHRLLIGVHNLAGEIAPYE